DAEFLFVPADQVIPTAKREQAIPYDVPNVELGHVDGRCSFESIVLKYNLKDPALAELARIVHGADVADDISITAQSAGLSAIALLSASIAGVVAATVSGRIGRRYTLAGAGLLMAIAGFDLALANSPLLLGVAAATGMLGAASVDLGPFASIEQAALAESVEPGRRNLAFARYSLTGGLAAAAGGLLAGTATDLNRGRILFAVYALVGLVTAVLALLLSPRAEAPVRAAAISATEIRKLAPLSALFAIDALGGGLVVNAVIAYWLHVRFGAPANVLGPAFAAIALLQAAS